MAAVKTDAHSDETESTPGTAPIPESWAELGDKEQPTVDQRAFYAVEVADHPELDSLLVRYSDPGGELTTVLTFDRHESDEGAVVPQCVADEGPQAFPAAVVLHESNIDQICRPGAGYEDHERVWELYESDVRADGSERVHASPSNGGF